MDLGEKVDPEDWYRIMDRFFRILSDGVQRFEGIVDNFTADGIMAIFGAPITHEDHARRACYAALYLKDELRRYAEELKRARELGFAVRMGLNSGEVVVGTIGDDLKMVYTAQGNTVGLGQRMEQLAAPDQVYLTENSAKLVSGFFRLRDLGPFELKGVSTPIRVYELEGVGPLHTPLEVSRSGRFSRFVGRADEMTSLEAALSRALDGNGQVVGIVGSPASARAGSLKSLWSGARVAAFRSTAVTGSRTGRRLRTSRFWNSSGNSSASANKTTRRHRGGRSNAGCSHSMRRFETPCRSCSSSWAWPIRNTRARESIPTRAAGSSSRL
jgi:class 3 adenylate cyclase